MDDMNDKSVIFGVATDQGGAEVIEDKCPTLTLVKGRAWIGGGDSEARHYIVRKLTPVEAERLQAFPDGWTDIPWHGKEHSPDSRRFETLGNSMCVNVMRWIGKRIELSLSHPLEYHPEEENIDENGQMSLF